jgi:hypothetical protein
MCHSESLARGSVDVLAVEFTPILERFEFVWTCLRLLLLVFIPAPFFFSIWFWAHTGVYWIVVVVRLCSLVVFFVRFWADVMRFRSIFCFFFFTCLGLCPSIFFNIFILIYLGYAKWWSILFPNSFNKKVNVLHIVEHDYSGKTMCSPIFFCW